MSMQDVLMEELKRKRRYLLYLGERVEKLKKYVDVFEEVSKEEFLEYVFNGEKSKSLEKRLYK